MALFKILHRVSGSVLFQREGESLKIVMQEAVRDGADLCRADLVGGRLIGANLAGANLAGANLARADLFAANLVGADLAGADLARTNLYAADLAGARYGHGVPLTRAPIQIQGLTYRVLIL